ncbi:BRCA1-associated RING domain protein 1 [Carex littledalei]|uniref:BRCA1-associated RING domain protein 1 n=1 Tax=Carex littledalei TaxID=544730 RepID=A0A833R414_9POAL|nr:BRCA1-associated RING domain protein 1 [Carex littledalei]
MAERGNNNGGSSSSLSDLRDMEEKLKCFVWECIPKYMVSVCPTCKARFLSKNLKPAVHIEEMLKRYQEMMEAMLKVQNSDNGSPVGSFTGESSFILTPQSVQKGNGLLMNKSCQQASPAFEKRVHGLGINSYDTLSSKLTRKKPPRDSPAVVSTPSKSSNIAGPSQGHLPAADNEFIPPPPNSEVIANTSCTKDSCQVPCSNPSTTRNEKTERKELAGSSVKRLKLTSSRLPVGLYEDECIFCHSFRRNLEVSGLAVHQQLQIDHLAGYGELLCIQKGKVVTEPDTGSKAKVCYAHENCIEWAPVIYYEGDLLVNLRSEIQRSSKLTCAKCGLNGAALGCFYEHCPKSYHPPCAYRVDGCRWDTVNYCMLCPDHVSEKLPSDSDPTISDTAANGNGRTSSKGTLKTR